MPQQQQTKEIDSFNAKTGLDTADGSVAFYRLDCLKDRGIADISRLPVSIRILLEAVMRSENGRDIKKDDVEELAGYDPAAPGRTQIPFMPARVLLQDFTGVPAVVDLAAMHSAMARLGGDPGRVNPQIPVDLVIDHSIQVDAYGEPSALERNSSFEFRRNRERYEFLRWGQKAFQNFRVIPPASGICHQVNLEYLASVVQKRSSDSGPALAFFDSLVGTDSHTPMVNGLGVVGWGVGGIEAEAVMLGQPLHMLAPAVIGFRLTGALRDGATATDLVLTVTQVLREKGVVGKFVEFFGPGLSGLTVPDRATIANMAPEYGATIGYFPVDDRTLHYLRLTGRPESLVELVERYFRAQGLFRTDDFPDPMFQDIVELDMSTVGPSLAGPGRPQDRIGLGDMKKTWKRVLSASAAERGFGIDEKGLKAGAEIVTPSGANAMLTHGSVAIAAITSCTNTSNPSVMLGAGLLARKAVEAGLMTKPWVKTSLAPGSLVVTEYLREAGLMPYLEKLGFHVVGYGCTTCIGNSGPLPEDIASAVDDHKLVVAAVLSGNRNFEGRINPRVRAAFLASPLLVVAYAIAGTMDIDLSTEKLGAGEGMKPIYLKDIWPEKEEIERYLNNVLNPGLFLRKYTGIESSNSEWNRIVKPGPDLFEWKGSSMYIKEPPFLKDMAPDPEPVRSIEGARVLVMVGGSITTDHISPAGAIPPGSPAGKYLVENSVKPDDFNSYGSRRGNHHVMTRGTFANIRLRNQLAPGTEGGWTVHFPSGEQTSIFDAAERYMAAAVPTIVLAGKDYGMGSSRDWAAKGTLLLGIKAVIAESYERIHRSNLMGMGVLPLQFKEGDSAAGLGLTGKEIYTIHLDDDLEPGRDITCEIESGSGPGRSIKLVCRLDSPVEVDTFRNGGILQTVLRKFLTTPQHG
ncbi:MAG: aconitate hydratase AcnA [Pseudomonadota bacterium]